MIQISFAYQLPIRSLVGDLPMRSAFVLDVPKDHPMFNHVMIKHERSGTVYNKVYCLTTLTWKTIAIGLPCYEVKLKMEVTRE
jgi:hypothetical protein